MNTPPPTNDPTLMKDANRKKKAAGGIAGLLGKLGLGGGAASSGASGGIMIGGASAVAPTTFLAAMSANAGIVVFTLIGTIIGIGVAVISAGHAPKAVQSHRFFAKLDANSHSETSKAAQKSRENAMLSSGMDGNGISSSLQHLVDANVGTLGQMEGDVEGEGGETISTADASAEVPENTVQAPDNDWSGGDAKADAAASIDGRKKLRKAAFKKRSSGASTKIALASPGGARRVAGSPGGKLTNFSAGRKSAGRSRSAARTRKSVSRGRGGGASAQLNAHSGLMKSNAHSSSPSQQAAVMDGGRGQIGSAGAGASTIAGAGGESSGNDEPIVNPVTSQNTSAAADPPPPIKKKKDKTPYRKEIKMAAGLLILATALVMIASMIVRKGGLKNLTMAKILAGIAFIAASAAAALGAIIMIEHKQQLQGGMIAAVGGMTALAAGKVVLMPEEAATELAKAETAKKGFFAWIMRLFGLGGK